MILTPILSTSNLVAYYKIPLTDRCSLKNLDYSLPVKIKSTGYWATTITTLTKTPAGLIA